MIDDTHPQVKARVDAIFAAMTPNERFAAMASMTDFVCDQSLAATAATMPGASRMEVALRWSELHYGRADGARATIPRRATVTMAARHDEPPHAP